jgi:hypothetical protein
MNIKTMLAAALCALAALPALAAPISEEEAREIAVEAYLYSYPLVTMELTRRQVTNVASTGVKAGRGPANSLIHMRAYPDGSFRDVVRPNFDTLYSFIWLDLRREPMVISIPDNKERYYLMPLLDMWTEVFASPGSRTTGHGPHTFVVVAPGWGGKLPANMERIESPTPVALMAGRTQTNGVADYAAVHAFQDGMRIAPLSQWGKPQAPVTNKSIDASVDMKTPPKVQANALPASAFFKLAADLMRQHAPHGGDQPILARMKRLGIEPGRPFELKAQDPMVQRALEAAVPQGQKMMGAKLGRLAQRINGWIMPTENLGNFGNSYLTRAAIAVVGLGANAPEDSMYAFAFADADNKPLNGEARYAITFAKGELPPARAFWSVTLYDNQSFPVPNPQQRYAIGSADAPKANEDGSVTLYVQTASPGADKESNWLPAPPGPFNLTLRAYYPKQSMLSGEWQMPAVRKAD